MKQLIEKVANLLTVSQTDATLILVGAAIVVLLAIVLTVVVIVKNNRKKNAVGTEEIEEQASEELKQEEIVACEQVEEEQPVVEEKPVVTEKPVAKKQPAKKPVKKVAEQPVAPAVEEKPAKPVKKLNGKWTIGIKRENEYIAQLLASNGEIMLNSEVYSTPEGAKNGINTIINGVKNGKFVVYSDKSGEYYFKLKSANNKLLCAGEIYKTKDGCLSAVESVKRIAEGSPVADGIDASHKYVEFNLAPLNEQVLNGAKGKWKVEQTAEGLYLARLYANNGQLMLATEEVSKKATATTAVESVKKNAEAGNFVIDKDKFGRFYYKLRNVQKSVICIGEAYDSLDTCVSAIESVRKFALNSPIV